ncbi:hypothetical protein [Streptomyces sp. 1222.5]|uniref:hypothetical protein n=1 Tax=Streptomyces sp. 1222.5 TaxID=1881026 RepID=UPI003D754E86
MKITKSSASLHEARDPAEIAATGKEGSQGTARTLDADLASSHKGRMSSQTTDQPNAEPPSDALVDRHRTTLAAVCLVASAIVITYWIVWFSDRSLLASGTRQSYIEFEEAFPLADGWLTLCLLLAAAALLGRRAAAPYWLLAAGACGLYLFFMDVLYDIQHTVWTSGTGGGMEAVINGLTLAMSLLFLRVSWTSLVQRSAEPTPRR